MPSLLDKKLILPWYFQALLGGMVGLLMDQIHVRYSVLEYQSPVIWGQAWWVFPLFAIATLLMSAAAKLMIKACEKHSPVMPMHRWTLISAILFISAYFASGVFAASSWKLALVFLGGWLVYCYCHPNRKIHFFFALALALSGTLFEAWLSSTGVFWYHFQDRMGVPFWLPGLYLFGAPLVLDTATA